jgi:hypothetical protein
MEIHESRHFVRSFWRGGRRNPAADLVSIVSAGLERRWNDAGTALERRWYERPARCGLGGPASRPPA